MWVVYCTVKENKIKKNYKFCLYFLWMYYLNVVIVEQEIDEKDKINNLLKGFYLNNQIHFGFVHEKHSCIQIRGKLFLNKACLNISKAQRK